MFIYYCIIGKQKYWVVDNFVIAVIIANYFKINSGKERIFMLYKKTLLAASILTSINALAYDDLDNRYYSGYYGIDLITIIMVMIRVILVLVLVLIIRMIILYGVINLGNMMLTILIIKKP
ncbi:hypothetical protein A6041_02830 [[Haemophilus] ducreyi]|nr:hypothetical protein RZ67_04480 [[Haemophilus] ducreyi]AKO48247.1 hypothetical protein RZ68_04465 [[Haemophilus] ducreyi]ANF67571.1 hypothetical protein A6041_02830 [[Haemophilus] ducreyi]ANF68553.1 hypothetical protein A6042_00505 [[Haemophilus] ducreyi]OOS04825.1 hypothetical protein B0190_00760 [[Haemophilus] ducreyi]